MTEAKQGLAAALPSSGARVRRALLPPPTSARHGTAVLLLGFAVEGLTELYQLLERGNLARGPAEFYTSLATTILGFYLMYLGLREWHAFRPRPARRPGRGLGSPGLRLAALLWAGGTVLTGCFGLLAESAGPNAAPAWIAWPVGGVVVLAFASFFNGLRREASQLGSRTSTRLAWLALGWSFVPATWAGWVVGEAIVRLFVEFFTNWVALLASIGPVVVAMSLLCVTYTLLVAAFLPGLRGVDGDALPRHGGPG